MANDPYRQLPDRGRTEGGLRSLGYIGVETRRLDDWADFASGLLGMQLVDRRAALLSLDEMRKNAPDEYAMVRNAWLQRRTFLIEGDRRNRQQQESDLPDYLREEERDPTVPADAMPMPVLPGG